MTAFTYTNHAASFVRSTALVFAVAAIGYLAGAVVHQPALSRGVEASFAQPAQAAERDFREMPSVTGTVPAAIAIELDRVDGELITQPRECDLPKNVATACLFMD